MVTALSLLSVSALVCIRLSYNENYAANSTWLIAGDGALGIPPTVNFLSWSLSEEFMTKLQDCLWSQSWFLPSNYVMVLIYRPPDAAVSYSNVTSDILCCPQQCYYLLQVKSLVLARQQHLLPFILLCYLTCILLSCSHLSKDSVVWMQNVPCCSCLMLLLVVCVCACMCKLASSTYRD